MWNLSWSCSKAAWSRPLMDIQADVCLTALGALKLAELFVDVLQQGRKKALGFLVGAAIRGAETEHERVAGLLSLGPLEELGASSSDPHLRIRALCYLLHVLPLRAEESLANAKLVVLFDANEKLALTLRCSTFAAALAFAFAFLLASLPIALAAPLAISLSAAFLLTAPAGLLLRPPVLL